VNLHSFPYLIQIKLDIIFLIKWFKKLIKKINWLNKLKINQIHLSFPSPKLILIKWFKKITKEIKREHTFYCA